MDGSGLRREERKRVLSNRSEEVGVSASCSESINTSVTNLQLPFNEPYLNKRAFQRESTTGRTKEYLNERNPGKLPPNANQRLLCKPANGENYGKTNSARQDFSLAYPFSEQLQTPLSQTHSPNSLCFLIVIIPQQFIFIRIHDRVVVPASCKALPGCIPSPAPKHAADTSPNRAHKRGYSHKDSNDS